jgi:pyruvate kinase
VFGPQSGRRSPRTRRSSACVTIMADLPGPKIRIGGFGKEPIELKPGGRFTLTAEDIVGDDERVSVSFSGLPKTVNPGDMLFLNDGYVQLEVKEVRGKEVVCKVVVGGELRSRKGLNLPGINLGISAFTDRDRQCLEFAREQGVDAVSQSFVETASDIREVREAAERLRHHPFIIAKIERAGALKHIEEILEAADGMMIARGDLGVETTLRHVSPSAVIVPTRSGATARSIARFRLPVWITAVSSLESTCRNLQFTYGVQPVHASDHPEDWKTFAREWLSEHGVSGDLVILTEGPSSKHPEANNRMEIINLGSTPPRRRP